jgi:hypothetical protein
MAYQIETVQQLSDTELFLEIKEVGFNLFLWDVVREGEPGYSQYLENLASFVVPENANDFSDILFDGDVSPIPLWSDVKARFYNYVIAEHQEEFDAMEVATVLSELKISGLEYFSPGLNWLTTVVLPAELKPNWAQMKAKKIQLQAIQPAKQIKAAILGAMKFGQDLMADYGVKNVLRNYNTAQTRQISADLTIIQTLLLSGSLYSALEEILAFAPTNLILEEDIAEFATKIRNYLGI